MTIGGTNHSCQNPYCGVCLSMVAGYHARQQSRNQALNRVAQRWWGVEYGYRTWTAIGSGAR